MFKYTFEQNNVIGSFLQNMRELPGGFELVRCRASNRSSFMGRFFRKYSAAFTPMFSYLVFLFLPLCTQDVILWTQNPTCDSRAAGDIRYAHILYTDCYGKDKQNKVHQSEGYGGGETPYLRACQFCWRNPFRIRQKSSAF